MRGPPYPQSLARSNKFGARYPGHKEVEGQVTVKFGARYPGHKEVEEPFRRPPNQAKLTYDYDMHVSLAKP